MPAAWISAGSAILGAMGSGNSQGGSQTMDKSPWAPAQPWLQNNIATGQNLQNYYQQNPFNALQQGAYANLLGNNDYINQMVPGLLGQFSQTQGFDRSNPRAKPMAVQFPQMAARAPMMGLLSAPPSAGGTMNITQNPFANGMMPAAAPAAASPAAAAYGSLLDLGSGSKYATFDPSAGGG